MAAAAAVPAPLLTTALYKEEFYMNENQCGCLCVCAPILQCFVLTSLEIDGAKLGQWEIKALTEGGCAPFFR